MVRKNLNYRQILYSSLIILILGGTLFLTLEWLENRHQTTSETLFVYGTLKNPIIRFYACRCLTSSEELSVSGYRVEDRNLIPTDIDSKVNGYLLAVTPTELERFDRYEGVPEQYQRVKHNFDSLTAWVYVKRP